MSSLDDMIERANAARNNAYVPYVAFKVGVCLRTSSGHYFSGANVQNASLPLGQCAESSAVGAMITAGERDIAEIVIVTDTDVPCTPCGGCRQILAEFAASDVKVHAYNTQKKHLLTTTIHELLPFPFQDKTMETH